MTRSTPRDPSARCNGLLDPRRPSTSSAWVVRPGGRVRSSTPTGQPSASMSATQGSGPMVREAMRTERARPSKRGSRLGDLARAADLTDVRRTVATQVWHQWNPDESPAPDGCFSMQSLAEDLVDRGRARPGRRGPLRLDRSRRRPAGTVLDVPDDVRGDRDGAAVSGCWIVPGQPCLRVAPRLALARAWPQSSSASVPPFGRRHVAWDPGQHPRSDLACGSRQIVRRLPSNLLTLRARPTLVAVQLPIFLASFLRTPHSRSSSVKSLVPFVAIEAHYPSAKRLSPP